MRTEQDENDLTATFAPLDEDRTGSIDARVRYPLVVPSLTILRVRFKELRQAFGSVGLKLSKAQLRDFMSDIDTDGDGSIAPDEFFCGLVLHSLAWYTACVVCFHPMSFIEHS